ncbi:SMI1/KNR4 family protein [Streptomyces avicenniae]|uniref:SMI1/KNR4 family protein n=1 Tax=Streptomyces avicenniae TaxID=500153 RepID=UPI0006999BD0|nr:SMI1/KNR4 family protein [Streptomyces avicenniae]
MRQPAGALLAAIDDDDPAALSGLLAQGADPAAEYDDHGVVDLVAFRAADTGVVELLRPFITAGLPVDTRVPGWSSGPTMLGVAAMNGSLPMVEYLVAAGADVNHTPPGAPDDPDVGTVLTHAVGSDEPLPVVSALLRAGADPNVPRPDGWTPLMLAAHGGDVAVVEALLAAGADVRAAKGSGNRRTDALRTARSRRHDDVAALLRGHGAVDPTDGASEVAQWRAAHATTAVPRVHREVPDPAGIDACAVRLAALVPDVTDRRDAADPADPAAVAELEAAVGEPLPTDFLAYFRLFGGAAGLDVFEYDGLSVPRITDRWRGLTDLLAEGTFDSAEPYELDPDERAVRYRWWHPGWVPFAQDGGGNLHCIDLAPDRDGVRGQVFSWEIHGGPSGVRAPSFEQFLAAYRRRSLDGRAGWWD